MTKHMHTAAVGTALAVGVALALGGCGSSGSGGSAGAASSQGSASATPSSANARPDASITHADAIAIERTYDKDNDVAISKAMNPPYDATAWRTVDSGPVLAADIYGTKKAAFNKSKVKDQPTKSSKVLRAYGNSVRSSDGTGPWLLVVNKGAATKQAKDPQATASVFVKSAQGWRLDASIGAIDSDLLPAESGSAPALTKAQRQSAANAVPLVVDALTTGSMKHVSNPAPLKQLRKGFQMEGVKGFVAGATCRPWGTKTGTDASSAVVVGTDALRLTRSGTQTLAALNLDCRMDVYAQDGGTVRLGKDNAHVEGDDGKDKDALVRRASMQLLFAIPGKGNPKMLGVGGGYLIPPKH